MNAIIDSISAHISLSETDKELIRNAFTVERYEKGGLLLKEATYARHLFFIEKGYVRSFYRKEDGMEKTHWVYSADDFVTSWYSFFTEKPSFENLQLISDASIYSISSTRYNELYEKSMAFNAFINAYYQNVLAEIDLLMKIFSQLSAKEKYAYLLESHPELVRDVKLGYLASLLDISQETLSRVRAQV